MHDDDGYDVGPLVETMGAIAGGNFKPEFCREAARRALEKARYCRRCRAGAACKRHDDTAAAVSR